MKDLGDFIRLFLGPAIDGRLFYDFSLVVANDLRESLLSPFERVCLCVSFFIVRLERKRG